MRLFRTVSLRTRIILLVLVVAVVPLGLMGLWLSGSATRAAEDFVRARLADALSERVRQISMGWVPYRSALLDLAQHPGAVDALVGTSADFDSALRSGFDDLPPLISAVELRDDGGAGVVWRASRPSLAPAPAFGRPLEAEVPVVDPVSGTVLGALAARLPLSALTPIAATGPMAGTVMAAFDPETGSRLTPDALDPRAAAGGRYTWQGDEWLAVSQALRDPPLVVVAAAPVAPFVGPFRAAARRGGLILLLVGLSGVGAAVILTWRMTRALEELATAAEAVSAGDLDRSVAVRGEDEIARVARAFDRMIESLRTTLNRLAERESLAAVGAFAASLAHEVRNPLTSIQLDLQQVEERLPSGSTERAVQAQALARVRRLERTVSGALETARSGHVEMTGLDLREPLADAIHAARPAFERRDAHIRYRAPGSEIAVRGDRGALERVFLNLLLNAAQASGSGDTSEVLVEREGRCVTIAVRDRGAGMDPEALERAFDPFVSGRADGSGLGLPIARQIVRAHGGSIELRSGLGTGTTAIVALPLQRTPAETNDGR